MLRNVIQGNSTQEIYKIGENVIRGQVVVKDLATKTAKKADGVGTEIYFVDYDFVPTGHLADTDISDYTDEAEKVKVGTYAPIKRLVSGVWATNQVKHSGLTEGDYLVAGTGGDVGLLVKAEVGKTSILKYIGTYNDGGKVLYSFEVVEPKTLA